MTETIKTFPSIQGRCPACRGDSLFIGSGGYITCSRIDCPDPSAADELLHGERIGADTPLVCSDERHAAKVADIKRQLNTAREAFASTTTRAARAEAEGARVRALRDTWLCMTLEPGQVRRLLDGITAALDQPAATEATEHRYLSTGCLHNEHAYCQSNTGQAGAKTPAQCKWCKAPCLCPCHQETGPA